jgi:hypothetical protein
MLARNLIARLSQVYSATASLAAEANWKRIDGSLQSETIA